MNARYACVSPISPPISDMKTPIRYNPGIRNLEPWSCAKSLDDGIFHSHNALR